MRHAKHPCYYRVYAPSPSRDDGFSMEIICTCWEYGNNILLAKDDCDNCHGFLVPPIPWDEL